MEKNTNQKYDRYVELVKYHINTDEARKLLSNKKKVMYILDQGIGIDEIYRRLSLKLKQDRDIIKKVLDYELNRKSDKSILGYPTEIEIPGKQGRFSVRGLIRYKLSVDKKWKKNNDIVDMFNEAINKFEEEVRKIREEEKKKAEEEQKLREKEEQDKKEREEQEKIKQQRESELLSQTIDNIKKQISKIKENPLLIENIKSINEIDTEYANLILKGLSDDECYIFSEAIGICWEIDCFKEGTIKLKDISEDLFSKDVVIDRITKIACDKFKKYVTDQTDDLAENEKIDEELLNKIKEQEQKVLKQIEEKKTLAKDIKENESKERINKAIANIEDVEV